jgi:nucleoside 2-deoxyribosyltransferase
MKYTDIYISGPLTNLDSEHQKLKLVYEKFKKLLEAKGLNVYVPHLKTDPIKAPNITPKEVWETDVSAVTKSDLIIAYVGIPALGVGQELEIARCAGKDIIIWSYEGERVTRMTLGCPAVIRHFVVKNDEEIYNELIKYFDI